MNPIAGGFPNQELTTFQEALWACPISVILFIFESQEVMGAAGDITNLSKNKGKDRQHSYHDGINIAPLRAVFLLIHQVHG